MTAAQLERKLKGTPLQGQGAAFIAAGRRYRLDPRLLVAITGAESSYGHHQSGTNNPFGWGPGIDFPSYEAAIDTVAQGLRANYLNQGLRTIQQIGSKYAPVGAGNDPTNLNSDWVENVTAIYRSLGGRTPGAAAPASPRLPSPGGTPPGLTDVAFQNLGLIAQGRYSPQEALSGLVQASAVSQDQTDVSDRTDVPTVSGGITYAGQKLTHETAGLGGYPAVDLFAKPGTPFLAPESGRVVRHSGRGGTTGGFYGWSVYFQGDSGRSYYIQHLNRSRAPKGRYRKGQVLGTVSSWESGEPHAHVGIRG